MEKIKLIIIFVISIILFYFISFKKRNIQENYTSKFLSIDTNSALYDYLYNNYE